MEIFFLVKCQVKTLPTDHYFACSLLSFSSYFIRFARAQKYLNFVRLNIFFLTSLPCFYGIVTTFEGDQLDVSLILIYLLLYIALKFLHVLLL
jgi:hypothetical protein